MNNNTDYIEREKPKPTVLKYYTAYCVMMGLMYLGVFALGFCLLVIDPRAFGINDEQALRELGALKIQGVMMTGLGAILSIPYLAAPFLPKKPWVWIYGIVLIGIGMSSCCLLPLAIPLLIYWIKPETKYWYGKT